MVCFYEEFDKDPMKIWDRITIGEHFTEENCVELLKSFKIEWKGKRKSNEEDFEGKKIKLAGEISKNDIRKSRSSQENSTSTEVGSQLSSTFVLKSSENQSKLVQFFKTLPPEELDNIKTSLKLAEEQAIWNSSHDFLHENEEKPSDDRIDESESEQDLSVSDLNILIENFESLKSNEQVNLLKFLEKLEAKDPEKFRQLH
jgi:hypothetical protein